MTRTRNALAYAAATLLALTLTGCNNGGEDTGEDPAPAETANQSEDKADPAVVPDTALETAVRTYTNAYFALDPDTAYDTLSKRCQGSIDPDMYAATVMDTAADYGQLTVESFAVDQISGDMARVTYTVGLPVLDKDLVGQPWVREDGEWRYDAC